MADRPGRRRHPPPHQRDATSATPLAGEALEDHPPVLLGKAPHFAATSNCCARSIAAIRMAQRCREINQYLIRTIARDWLGIRTDFAQSPEFPSAVAQGRSGCSSWSRRSAATLYVSGPAAQAYLDAERFRAAGIELVWKDYSGYPEYPQLHPPFEHAVIASSTCCSTPAPMRRAHIWGWRESAGAPAGGTEHGDRCSRSSSRSSRTRRTCRTPCHAAGLARPLPGYAARAGLRRRRLHRPFASSCCAGAAQHRGADPRGQADPKLRPDAGGPGRACASRAATASGSSPRICRSRPRCSSRWCASGARRASS